MATNLPSCFFIQFLEQLLKFLVNFTLLKYVKSQRSYGFLITKELIFGFQILDLKDHFSASLNNTLQQYKISLYGMFHVTWTTFKFNRNQLGTVSAFVTITMLWSNQRVHQVTSEKLLSKEFHCGTTDHK